LRFRPAIDGTGTHASHPSRSAPVREHDDRLAPVMLNNATMLGQVLSAMNKGFANATKQ
jgi:hypothetical protein